MGHKGPGHGNDRVGLSIGEALEPFEKADGEAFLHRADRNDAFWPEVANFEHPGRSLEEAGKSASKAAEEWRRRRHDDVRPGKEWQHEDDAGEIGDIIENAAREAFVGGQQRPNANDPDAIDHLGLIEPIAVAWVDLAVGMVGRAGDDSDVMALGRPGPTMIGGP